MNRDLKVLSLAIFVWGLGEGLFIHLVPLHIEALGAGPVQIGGVMAIYALVQAVVMIPAGVATDRWGARKVLLGGWLVGVAAAVLMASTTRLPVFALGWTMYGASAWVLPPLTSFVTAKRAALTPERALTLVYSAYWASLIVSPTLGGFLGQQLGLRANYAVATIMFCFSTAVMLFVVAPPPALSTTNRRYRSLLRNRRFVGIMVVLFCAMFALWLGVPLAPNFLQDRWGVDIAGVGLLGSANSLGAVVLALFLGRQPPRRAFVALQAMGAVYLLILLNSGQLGWLAVGFFLRAGPAISREFVDAMSTRVVPLSQHGLAFAISATVIVAAGAAAPALAGWLYSLRPSWPFQLGLGLLPVAVGLTYYLAPQAAADDAQPTTEVLRTP